MAGSQDSQFVLLEYHLLKAHPQAASNVWLRNLVLISGNSQQQEHVGS